MSLATGGGWDRLSAMSDERASDERAEGGVRVWVEAILVAVIFLKFANLFVLQTFYIPSRSMEDTLLVGDHLFVNRFIYGAEGGSPLAELLPHRPVRRGDVLVFRSVEDPAIDVVKRCVALAGDVVELRDQTLLIDGRPIDESAYAVYREDQEEELDPRLESFLRRRQSFAPLEVPEGHVFCLGDNRNHSNDSRFWGPLPIDHVAGRAWMIYWSYGGETPDGTWPGLGPKLVQLARTVVGFPFKTRWKRTFEVVR